MNARRLIGWAARLVPAHRREAFRRQWEADLAYRLSQPDARGSDRAWALGAFRHAGEIRRLDSGGAAGWIVDLRQGVRALARRPALAGIAVGIFAVGIGTAASVFSVVDAVLLRPYPFDEPETLVSVDMVNPVLGMDQVSVTWPDADEWLREGPLASGAVWRTTSVDLADGADPRRLQAARVGPSFFPTLRARPVAGRLLDDEDERVGAPAVVVLSERLWEQRWGRDPEVIGRTVRLDGDAHTVVGVVSNLHRWPAEADAWTALGWGGVAPEWADSRDNFTWNFIARLAPGTSHEEASERISQLVARTRADADSEQGRAWRPNVATLHGARVGSAGVPVSILLFSAVLALVLIASFNVAGLLLVRASERARDLGLRAALGAGRGRLFRQLMLESVILAAAGGVVGVALGHVLLRTAATRLPDQAERLAGIELHPGVLAIALAVTLFAALVGGLAPALRGARAEVADALRDATTGASSSKRRRRVQRALVVAELALGTVLLLGAGLTHRAFRAALDTDAGFEVDGLLVFEMRLPAARYEGGAEIGAFLDGAVAELAAAPGIERVATTSTLPLGVGGMRLRRAFLLDGEPDPPEGSPRTAQWIEVDEAWFETLGIDPLRGRRFSAEDGADAPPVAMVNASMARALGAEGELLGRTIRSVYDENLPRTIVGVIPSLRMNDTELEDRPLVLVPRRQSPRRSMSFLVRTTGDPGAHVPTVRDRVGALDPDVALDGMASLRTRHADAVAGVRFVSGVFSLFGLSALLLGTIGVYSLVSFTVAAQVREIGIRMAIGASLTRVRGRVVGEGLILTAAGLGVGAVLGALFVRVLASVVQGPSWTDPVLWIGVPALLGSATLLATVLPAIRATRIDPARALRAD